MTLISRSIIALGLLFLAADAHGRQPDDGDIEAKATVVVAKQRIPVGTFIKEPGQFFETKEIAETAVPAGAITKIEELREVRISRTIHEDGILSQGDFRRPEQNPAARIPPGFRATAIRIDTDGLAPGFLRQDSRIDILWTFRNEKDTATYTIFQDIQVLAVEQIGTSSTVGLTLAVQPEDAQQLALAVSAGTIRVSIRPPGDEQKSPLQATKLSDLNPPVADVEEEEEEVPPAVTVPPTPAPPPAPPMPEREEVKVPEPPVPPAHRAFAVRFVADPMANEFILPGSRVDVLLTTKDAKEVRTETVLENVQVLAIDAPPVRQVKGTREKTGVQIVTLALTLEEGERLQQAVASGEIRLALRQPDAEEAKPSGR